MEVDGIAGEAEDDNFEERLETTWNNPARNQSTSVRPGSAAQPRRDLSLAKRQETPPRRGLLFTVTNCLPPGRALNGA